MYLDRLGLHVIRSQDAVPLVRQAAEAKRPFPVVLSVNQPTLAAEVKAFSPTTKVVTRFTGDEAWGYGARLERGEDPKAVAWALYQHVLAGRNRDELAAADYIAIENEQDPDGPLNYGRLAVASVELGRIVFEQLGKRLAHLGLNAGTPEWTEILAMRDAGLYEYLAKSGNCLNVHEGVIPPTERRPIQTGVGDHIPGGPAQRAYGAGSMVMRHEYHWQAAGGERFDILVGEFYPGGGTSDEASVEDVVARFSWYNQELRPRVIGFLPFTLDPEGGWATQRMNKFYPSVMKIKLEGPPVTTKPAADCNRTDVPENWTHTVESTLGLNVRSTPEVPSPVTKNLLCTMVNGKQVRALKRQGDWMQIDWPVAGWCFAPNLKPRPATAPVVRKLGRKVTLQAGARFIDVSAWQDPADIDWKALKWNGCEAVMIRLAAGTLTDPEWHLYAAGAEAVGMPWFGYVYFSFLAPWQSQMPALTPAISKMSELPTIAMDLEGSNPGKEDADLRSYVSALALIGTPVDLYTRQNWVSENLPQLRTIMPSAQLIVANYRYPVESEPALPIGWAEAEAWQHVAGEKVITDKFHWARYRTRSGKFLDESIVLQSGFEFNAGKL